MKTSNKSAIFARLGSRPIPRVIRMMKVAKELGYNPLFCGAMREADLKTEDTWSGWNVVRVGKTFPLLNGKRPFLYVKSVFNYNLGLYRLLKTRKPGFVHASDCEAMPAAILYSFLHNIRLIYNIHDNVAQRYSIPAFAMWILNVIEGLLVLASDVTLVPEEFRRDALPSWCRRKIKVIRNTPEDQGFSPPELTGDGKIRLFYGGWLDWGRGLKTMVTLAERTPEIELRMAGEGAPEIVEYLKAHPRVTYLGFISHAESLEHTRWCHFVPSIYEPSRIINLYAASNKLAEALSVGRPLLINKEVKLAEQFADRPCIVSDTYTEIEKIGDRLKAMMADKERYLAACRAARDLYDERYAWEPVHQAIRRVIGGDEGTEDVDLTTKAKSET